MSRGCKYVLLTRRAAHLRHPPRDGLAGLGCVLPQADANYELGLMQNIEPSESFGLGSVGFQQVAFKRGWGPEPNDQYGVRQTGIIGNNNSGVVVSLTADPVSTFAVGQSVLDQLAQWLHEELQLTRRRASSCPT